MEHPGDARQEKFMVTLYLTGFLLSQNMTTEKGNDADTLLDYLFTSYHQSLSLTISSVINQEGFMWIAAKR